jgi:tetratricopeptide (TPR) repeat protein
VEFDHDEYTYANILGIANRALKEGRNLQALVIFGPLAKVDEFSQQAVASRGEAMAKARLGQFQQSLPAYEKQLARTISEDSEPTVYRANTLVTLAGVRIGLQSFDEVEDILDEATRIYSDQGIPEHNAAAITHLHGIVALQRGEYRDAWAKFDWAKALSEGQIPNFVPTEFGIEASLESTTMERELLMAPGSRTTDLR